MRTERGVTLPELVITIVVLGVGLAGVLLAFNQSIAASADPLQRKQMLSIAEEMLEEIRLRSFVPAAPAAAAGCARAAFNDIDDYAGYAQPDVCDLDGNPIPALAGYAVAVAIAGTPLNGVPAKRIAVTVSRGTDTLTLVGYRTGWAL
jgi:MSHA pilin protein MshD